MMQTASIAKIVVLESVTCSVGQITILLFVVA